MIKIAYFVPNSQHTHRGIGFYSNSLLEALKSHSVDPSLEIHEFSSLPPQDADLIHYPYFDLFSHSLPFFSNKPRIVSILDVIPLEYPQQYRRGIKANLNLALQKLSLHNINHVITISLYSKRQILKFLPVNPATISVSYLAPANIFPQHISASKLHEIKEKYHLPDKFILYVGDVNWSKNLPNLTKTCVDLSLPLVVVGKTAAQNSVPFSHPETQHFANWLHLYRDHPLVHRVGFVSSSELAAIYKLATIYVQPSFSEGFGLSLLEAMSLSVPCAASCQSSLPEIGGDAVAYFDPHNTSDIGNVLMPIYSDPNYAKSLSQRAKARSSFFSCKKTAAETIHIYRSILNSKLNSK